MAEISELEEFEFRRRRELELQGQQPQQAKTMESEADRIVKQQQAGELSGFEAGLQATALGLDYYMDKAGDFISEWIPPGVKDYSSKVLKSMQNAAAPIMNTPSGMAGAAALREGGEAWDDFESSYPRLAKDIEAVGKIGAVAMVGARPTAKLLDKAVFQGKWNFLDDVVSPYKLKDVDLSVMRTEGLKGKAIVPLNKDQEAIKSVLKTIPGIRGGNTHARNYEIIRNNIGIKANQLMDKLGKSKKKVNQKELVATINKAADNFDKEYDLSSRMDLAERQRFIADVFDRIGNPKTTSELLEARKLADQQFRKFNSDRRMKPDGGLIPTRAEMKWKAARDSLNAMLEMKEPGYKKSIRDQHLMYRSLDILEDKVRGQIEDQGRSLIKEAGKTAATVISPRVNPLGRINRRQ